MPKNTDFTNCEFADIMCFNTINQSNTSHVTVFRKVWTLIMLPKKNYKYTRIDRRIWQSAPISIKICDNAFQAISRLQYFLWKKFFLQKKNRQSAPISIKIWDNAFQVISRLQYFLWKKFFSTEILEKIGKVLWSR